MNAVTAWRTDEPCPVCATGPDPARRRHLPAAGRVPPVRLGRHLDRRPGRTEVTSDRNDQQDDPGAADGDAAGPGCRPGPGRRARRLHPPDPAAPHQPRHRRGRQVLVPAGTPWRTVCPSCAERARTLRAAQCREGWHLEDEPDHQPPTRPPTTRSGGSRQRAEAQQLRDQAAAAGQDTADLDELITELDERDHQGGHPREGRPGPSRPGGTAPPAAARTPRTCPGARSAPARWARPTPRRTARPSARRCSSP